jgi:hypothetical protein
VHPWATVSLAVQATWGIVCASLGHSVTRCVGYMGDCLCIPGPQCHSLCRRQWGIACASLGHSVTRSADDMGDCLCIPGPQCHSLCRRHEQGVACTRWIQAQCIHVERVDNASGGVRFRLWLGTRYSDTEFVCFPQCLQAYARMASELKPASQIPCNSSFTDTMLSELPTASLTRAGNGRFRQL